MKRTPKSGFTYIELLIVLALVGIIATWSLTMGLSAITQSSVIQERDFFVTLLLRSARAEALANFAEKSHGVRIDTVLHTYTLFTGTSYVSGASDNRTIAFSNSHINVTNTGGVNIVFEQLSGNVTTGAGTLTFTDGNTTQQISINAVGQIDW